MWFDLMKNHNSLVDEHRAVREIFSNLGSKYEHLKVHDGNLDPLPDGILILSSRQIPSAKYCMAKTEETYLNELESLKKDLLQHESLKGLENRIIGPTNNIGDTNRYGDNFELHEIMKRQSGLQF